MKKEKKFKITRTNGSLPIEPWLEREIAAFAKREYGLNIVVKSIGSKHNNNHDIQDG
ncbi:hypothetical protein [Paenibacillus sp. FSL R10-2778]|jgi:hypothetical protein|uniref:hypothetical protein n=1 Tax=Paenibacillus sp. FSL R10-2778 TaxID=2954659 RepID=UPI00315930A5